MLIKKAIIGRLVYVDEKGSIKVLTIEFTAAANTSDDPDQNRYNDKIKITGISLSDENNEGIDLDDVEIPVFYKVGVNDIGSSPKLPLSERSVATKSFVSFSLRLATVLKTAAPSSLINS